jgi:uncharacterized membrane protein YqjE
MAKSDTTPSLGLLASLMSLVNTLVSTAHTRLQLLALDLEEDRLYLLLMVKLMFITMFCVAMGVVLMVVFVAVIFWDTHRVLTLGLLSGGFFLLAILSWRYAAYKAKQKPTLFTTSLGELLKDKQALSSALQDHL